MTIDVNRVRAAYRRSQRALECFAGVILAGFGAKLMLDVYQAR